MMKLKSILVSLLLCATLVPGCVLVHEFPEPGGEVDPTYIETHVKINCVINFSGISVITKSLAEPIDPSVDTESEYDRRFLVQIRTNEYVDTLVESHVITRDVADTSPLTIETNLRTRKYKVIVWMDYVRKGTTDDLFYYTDNGKALNAIHLPTADKYIAGSDFKDVQNYVAAIDLTPFANRWFADIVIDAPLTRPVAKVTFLASDFEEYANSIGYTGNLADLANDLSVEFSYNGYFPTGFNATTGRLNDSEAGFGFKNYSSYPYSLEKTNYLKVGSDYIFVNGESSSVTISATIRSKSTGKIINEVNSVIVPLSRDKETVLIYKFLTKEYVPGIGIDPGFDGEFNVYV